jgi:hypothetical protein
VADGSQCKTHMAGEYFVAAELSKRGYSVSLTMGNAKAVDLLAERGGKAICIQVKAIERKQHSGWPLPLNKGKIIEGVVFVCVVLNGIGDPPTYYVIPPREVRERGKWYKTRAILDISAIRRDGFLDAWHFIDTAIGEPGRTITNIVERTVHANQMVKSPIDCKSIGRMPSGRGAKIIALCSRPEGATANELKEATAAPRTTPWKYDVEALQKYGYIARVTKRDGMSCYHLDTAPVG